jgi:hypothetical protein
MSEPSNNAGRHFGVGQILQLSNVQVSVTGGPGLGGPTSSFNAAQNRHRAKNSCSSKMENQ